VNLDIASIVPSARDFLQAIATQRKRLALVPLVERADEAQTLAEAGVAAFAMSEPTDAMRAVSGAIGALPLLSLLRVATDTDALTARAAGADAVIVSAANDAASWDALAKHARSTRMAALAAVTDMASAQICAKTSAKSVYLRVDGVADVAPLLRVVGSVRVLAHLPSVDEAALRALRGVVDAVIVESDLFLSTSFASLREELDP
jgi:hypothetical protein